MSGLLVTSTWAALGCGRSGPKSASVTPEPSAEAAASSAATTTAATTAAPRSTATASAPAGLPRGDVGGVEVRPRQAVFLWRAKADDLQLIFADVDDLCATLQAGAMPKNATVVTATLKHTAKSNRDAPFAAGDYPVRTASAIEPQDTKRAVVAKLDDACKPTKQAKATSGVVRLTTGELKLGGVAEGELRLTFGGDTLEGPFRATFCAPPEDEPRGCK